MSYTPTSWNTGDTITAAAMNKIENGIANAGSALICTLSFDDDLGKMVMDKTVQEIYDALISGTPVYALYQYGALGQAYASETYLAPVTKVYGYNYTGVIRICVNKPSFSGDLNTYNNTFKPSVAIFSATGLNDYPAFYTTVYSTNATVMSGGEVN